MTKQSDVKDNPNYRAVLDHGFVGIVAHLGDDAAIVQAARVSYGAGTKSVNEDRGLIRYLTRHSHTSPIEMCEVKLHIRLPIFVERQLTRHRTASQNQESARYSVMSDEFYIPARDDIQPQSSDNKQGRSGFINDKNKKSVECVMKNSYEHSNDSYKTLLGGMVEDFYDDGYFDENYHGVAREIARIVMPVSVYTEMYWKVDLHNLFHFLRLRADPHAQKEIRVYAEAIIELCRPLFPAAFEAWEDYSRYAKKISRMEILLLKEFTKNGKNPKAFMEMYNIHKEQKTLTNFAAQYDMSVRELNDFIHEFLE